MAMNQSKNDSMDRLLSKEEWMGMDRTLNRKIVGENPETGSYMAFFRRYFGKDYARFDNSYEMYCEWYKLENSPLGKAMK